MLPPRLDAEAATIARATEPSRAKVGISLPGFLERKLPALRRFEP